MDDRIGRELSRASYHLSSMSGPVPSSALPCLRPTSCPTDPPAPHHMPSLHFCIPNHPDSPPSSSPLPPTPFASSSPPPYPRVHPSSAYVSTSGPSHYRDHYDDISPLWPLARRARLSSLYASKHPAFPSLSDDEPHWTSKSDASALHERVIFEKRHPSPDDTDEEDEFEAFGDIKRQTCFATSSERGRWKSSPIPIKSYSHPYASASRSIEDTMPVLAPLNITGKSNSHTHSQWRRLSTASSISEPSVSPIAPTLPSLSQEPPSRHQTSSPLPPSSPPMSPMSATFSMPESDGTTEEDMLVDSDDEHQSEHVPDSTNSQSLSPHDAAHPESDSEAEEDSLIPAIATLDFVTARKETRLSLTLHKPLLQSPKPTPIHEPIALPHVTTMPTPETTPVAQDRDPMPGVAVLPTSPKTMTPPVSIKLAVDASAPTKQPLANKKNEPHPGQTIVHAPPTHIPLPMPTPTAIDVDRAQVDPITIPTSPTTASLPLSTNDLPPTVQIAPTVEGYEAPSTTKASEPLPAQSSAAESPLPMDVDPASAGPSRAATPFSESRLPKEGSVDQSLANGKNQLHPDCVQTVLSVDAGASMSVQTDGSGGMSDKDGSVNLPAAAMDGVQKEVEAVEGEKEKGDLPGGHGKEPEKKEVEVVGAKAKEPGDGHTKESEKKEEVAKKVIKPPRPSKRIIWKEAPAPFKAGPSRQAPAVDSTKPKETPRTVGAVAAGGKEPVKRKTKAEEKGEGPARKKKKVAKDQTVAEASETAKSSRNTNSSSLKPKTKKAKASSTCSRTSSASPTLDIDSAQLAEMQGMIIESFAVSRASALPPSALYRSITDNRPSLKSVRSQEQWMEVIEMALEEGQNNSSVFGKVESSFKDESDRALEAKWFYVPERDVDQERASLISSMMPRAAKRTETKKYKQYYYRPLDKISRWDPEDDP